MTSFISAAFGRRSILLSSVTSSFLLWPAGAWAQTSQPYPLEPVVVTPSAKPPVRRAARGAASSTARARQQQRNAARTAAAPAAGATAAPAGPVFAAPTLNLTGTTSTGSRLGLTRLQTPASVEVIPAETMA